MLDLSVETFSFDTSLITKESAKSYLLASPVTPVAFPLTPDIQMICKILREQVKQQGAAGFAANQLGFSWALAMVSVPSPEVISKFRADASDSFEALLINPHYEAMGKDISYDWEACFSLPGQAFQVPRFKHIKVSYQDEEGNLIHQEAAGFTARVLQHEIDHLNGILCDAKASTAKDL